jgi:hypothetical protein
LQGRNFGVGERSSHTGGAEDQSEQHCQEEVANSLAVSHGVLLGYHRAPIRATTVNNIWMRFIITTSFSFIFGNPIGLLLC